MRLLLPLMTLLVAGCPARPTAVRLALSADAGMTADSIRLTVFDRYGRVVDGAAVGDSGKLPGDVVVLLSPGAGAARALAQASQGGVLVGAAAAIVPIVVAREAKLALVLSPGALADADGDGVPDAIDNCPKVANPDQRSPDGAPLGEVCRGDRGDAAGADRPDGGPPPDIDGGAGRDDGGPVRMDGGAGRADGGTSAPGCGDGLLQPGEQCDDGARNSDDPASAASCTSRCRLRARCGSVAGALGAAIDPQSGHCYVAWKGPLNFATAQNDCQARGGTLAVITSSQENGLVGAIAGNGGAMWIGLEITHGAKDSFRWIDGEAVGYAAFARGQPDNGGSGPEECGAYTLNGWADYPCGFPATGSLPASSNYGLGYVCESGCGNGVTDAGEECDPPGPSCTDSCMRVRSCDEPGGVVAPENGHCYFALAQAVSYAVASSQTCPAGSHLATLGDLAETEAGQEAIAGLGQDAWIALTATSAPMAWEWAAPSTEPFLSRRYHGFAGAEPNETTTPNCARLSYGFGWRDRACTELFATLCERE